MKKSLAIIIILILCILAISCGGSFSSKEEAVNVEETVSDEYIVVGFSQLGAESDWRSANTESMKSAFTTENGYKLIFEDGKAEEFYKELPSRLKRNRQIRLRQFVLLSSRK